MARSRTVTILINEDGTVEFDQIGYKGNSCSHNVDDLLRALGLTQKVNKKHENIHS